MKNRLFCLLLLVSSNLFSQEFSQRNIDSLKMESIKMQQKLFELYPIRYYGWVTDYEKLFSKNQIKKLNFLIDEFEKETSNEIAIVTLNSLKVTDENFENLSLQIAQKWGIGKTEKNNGILIAISKNYRKIRIQNGNGIEKMISNEETKSIIENYFIPGFRNDKYYEGTVNGLLELMRKLKQKEN